MSDPNSDITTPSVEEAEEDIDKNTTSSAAPKDPTGHVNNSSLAVNVHPSDDIAKMGATGHAYDGRVVGHPGRRQHISHVELMQVQSGATCLSHGDQHVYRSKSPALPAGNEANPVLEEVSALHHKVDKVLHKQQELKQDVAIASQQFADQQDKQKKTDQTEREGLKKSTDQMVDTTVKLEHTSYELSRALKNLPVSKHAGPSPEMQYVFRANYQVLIDMMKIDEVLPFLFQNFKLESSDMAEIQALPTSHKKVTYLLNTLTKEENVKDMIEALKATNQKVLAQVLEKALPKETTV